MNYKLKDPMGIEAKVVSGYSKIEKGFVSTYFAIENNVVKTYKKIEKKFVDTFLEERPEGN